ncbi:hypothetical protein CAEBREN_05060 [Caenorhabditis brenneri]|uniref:3-beta hydroxysteroid dehydrogenase/isomerase domain-containing protein n=1 Tax=Caenorhabditis brenneri TaxID=135651 RepID=G0MJ17_CAEBE|nr:hypothetical protein CAEBREN_05060 [Caenorhabditis brenneri]
MSFHRIRQSFRRIRHTPEDSPKPPPPREIEIPERPYRILITGGVGHLAKCLRHKIEEKYKNEIRALLQDYHHAKFARENHLGQMGKSLRRRKKQMIATEIERETNNLLKKWVFFVLIDIINPPNSNNLGEHVAYMESKFEDESKMKTALQNVTVVYHLAAVGMTGRYARDRQICVRTNSTATTNLVSWARTAGVQRFIYASSVGVIFQGLPLINATERDTPYPHEHYNFYCESKAQAEEIVSKGTGPDMKTAIIRFSGIYGPGEKRVTQRVVDFMKTGFWIGLSMENGVEAQTQLSSVANCVQGLMKIDEKLPDPHIAGGRIYHIVDREVCGTFSFWAPINRALGFPDPYIVMPPWVLRCIAWICQTLADRYDFDPFVSVLEVDLLTITNTYSIARAERDLGYDPEPSPIAEIIAEHCSEVNTPEWQWQLKKVRWQQIFLFWVVVPIGLALIVWMFWPHSLFAVIGAAFLKLWVSYLGKWVGEIFEQVRAIGANLPVQVDGGDGAVVELD